MFNIEPFPDWFLTYLLAINLIAFIAIGTDQLLAEKAKWRIGNVILLSLGILGGTPGLYAARWMFRHKLKDSEFNFALILMVFVNVGLLIAGSLMGWEDMFEMITGATSGQGGMTFGPR